MIWSEPDLQNLIETNIKFRPHLRAVFRRHSCESHGPEQSVRLIHGDCLQGLVVHRKGARRREIKLLRTRAV